MASSCSWSDNVHILQAYVHAISPLQIKPTLYGTNITRTLTHIQSHVTCLCLVVCILQFQCHNIILCMRPGMGSWKNSRLHRWEIQVAEWEQQAAFTGIQRTRSWTCMHYVVGLTHPRLIPRLHPGLVAYCSMKIYTWRTLIVSNYWTSCTGLTFDPKIPLEMH